MSFVYELPYAIYNGRVSGCCQIEFGSTYLLWVAPSSRGSAHTVQRFSRAGPRGRGREWATQGVLRLSWLLSNNRLEEVCSTLTKGTFSSRLLLSNQDKGCTPNVAHSLPLPLGPALLNLSSVACVDAVKGELNRRCICKRNTQHAAILCWSTSTVRRTI